MKKIKQAQAKSLARTFDALGHYRRIDIFTRILSFGNAGVNFGTLSELTALVPSTLAHHIDKLHKGGVINKTMVGAATVYSANLDVLRESVDVLDKVSKS